MSIKTSVETITRTLAEHLLANQAVNRKLRQRQIEKLTEAMNRGMFNGENGETIILNGGQLATLRLADRLVAVADRTPMTCPQLVRYVRLQWPRLLPEAIERTIAQLLRARFLKVDEATARVGPREIGCE